jgi:2,5-diketo-D-gluconate reductase A
VETWEALCELRDSGRVRSIGVSNFTIEHLERIIDASGVVPAVNQVELHPQFQQRELREFHRRREIATEAWSPLGQGTILDDSTIAEIASSHGRSSAQVVLRWHLQLGNVVIPKSATPARIEENFQIFDFELSDQEMAALESLDAGNRIGPNPETFG